MWFSNDPQGGGFELHETEAEARRRAEEALRYEADNASDPDSGWSDEVTDICWGEVSQVVVEAWRKQRPPQEELEDGHDKDGTYWGEWNEMMDYELKDVDQTDERASSAEETPSTPNNPIL